jgi:hypothetical protein
MTVDVKVDSNNTGLRICEEVSIGVLNGDANDIFYPYEPNEYGDMGGEYTSKARNPINADRQRRKGKIVGLESKGAFTSDLLPASIQRLMQGFLFASFRRKGEEAVTAVDIDTSNPDEYEVASTTGFRVGDLIKGSGFTNAGNNTVNKVTAVASNTSVEVATGALTAEASPPSGAQIVVVGFEFGSGELKITTTGLTLPRLERASGTKDFTEFGLNAGEWIYIGGDAAGTKFATAACNGWARVRSVAATYIELDKTAGTIADDTGTSKTIRLFFGRYLKNEQAASIVRRTYQIERTLGSPDSASANDQTEYVVGAVPSELTLSFPEEDIATAEINFMGKSYETRDQTTGQKTATRPALVAEDAIDTANNIKRAKFALTSNSDSNVTPLFTYLGEASIAINNNITGNKAIGVLGSYELSAGNIEVTAEVTAQFQTVAALAARAANSSVTLDLICGVNNVGMAIDIPLITLGEGLPEVSQDEPITIPLKCDAASGVDVASALNHTISFTFFDYLPTVATA